MRLFSPRSLFHATSGYGWLLAAAFLLGAGHAGTQTPPQFTVPGQEGEMKALNELHALRAETAFSDCSLWDVWLPNENAPELPISTDDGEASAKGMLKRT